jgi:hypothetical protein
MADPYAQYVRWEHVNWINDMVGWRLYWFGVAVSLTILAAIVFDRFDSSHRFTHLFRWPRRKVNREHWLDQTTATRHTNRERLSLDSSVHQIAQHAQLSPVTKISGLRLFGRILCLELHLMLKQPWWWYLVSLWLIVTSLVVPVINARTIWVPLIWLWVLLTLSGTGIRDSYHHTEQMVFSAPHPLRHQFFATWLAGVILTFATGIAGGRLLLVGENDAILAWGIAAFFIPSFALASGIMSGNRRFFEGLYIAWWLIGPMASKGTVLDFMGVHPEVVARGVYWYYLMATVVLLGLALLGRWLRLRVL